MVEIINIIVNIEVEVEFKIEDDIVIIRMDFGNLINFHMKDMLFGQKHTRENLAKIMNIQTFYKYFI